MSDIKILKVRVAQAGEDAEQVTITVSYLDEKGRLLNAAVTVAKEDAKHARAALFRELLGDEPTE